MACAAFADTGTGAFVAAGSGTLDLAGAALGTCSTIRSQRKAHLRVWTVLAVFLPLGLALILSLAASQVIERAPQRLEQPGAAQGAGG